MMPFGTGAGGQERRTDLAVMSREVVEPVFEAVCPPVGEGAVDAFDRRESGNAYAVPSSTASTP